MKGKIGNEKVSLNLCILSLFSLWEMLTCACRNLFLEIVHSMSWKVKNLFFQYKIYDLILFLDS